jgi:hypothetical protein
MNLDAPHHCCSPLEGSSYKAFVCRFIFESHCVSDILTYVALFIYALKNMAITNIPAGNGIILSGNRQLAATFVKISKRRLWEMRQLMIMSKQTMMQRSFYLDRNCVWVRMHIIGNAEFIRIHACSEGEKGQCEFSTITPSTTIVSEYQLTCPDESIPDNPKLIKFDALYSVEFDSSKTNRWKWGEGLGDGGADHTEHVYTDSAIEYFSSQQHWDVVTAQATDTRESKSATGATQAAAYANFIAAPWVLGGGATLTYTLRDNGSPPNRWQYNATRATMTYDLGDGTTYPLDARNIAATYFSFNFGASTVVPGTGLGSSLGGIITTPSSSIELEDMASNIGTNGLSVDYDDSSGYSALPTIAISGLTGWFAIKQNSPGGDNIYITRKTIKFTEVSPGVWEIGQTGASVHERLESVE